MSNDKMTPEELSELLFDIFLVGVMFSSGAYLLFMWAVLS
jgi:hypothetical protein